MGTGKALFGRNYFISIRTVVLDANFDEYANCDCNAGVKDGY
jgi:hypothetical protein